MSDDRMTLTITSSIASPCRQSISRPSLPLWCTFRPLGPKLPYASGGPGGLVPEVGDSSSLDLFRGVDDQMTSTEHRTSEAVQR